MIGLEPFLTALREAGLPVGVAEVARLHEVFARSPEPGGPRLETVLRAVLVKSAEDRAVFDRVFATWLNQADHEVQRWQEEPVARPVPVRAARTRRRRPRLLRVLGTVAAFFLLVLLSLSLGGHGKVVSHRTDPTGRTDPTDPGVRRPSQRPDPLEPPQDQPGTTTVLVPVLAVSPGPWPGWWPLGLAWAALAVGAGLWVSLRGRSWLPEPAPEPTRKGPPRVLLSAPAFAGLQLLQPREEEALVWGIGHFIADEPTRRLDLPATVRATAQAAGFPHLRFHLARHPREVWLWIDEAADDPAIPRLAAEVVTALAAHGLPVERAFFRGVPDRLEQEDGLDFAPNEVDERRDAALVAIFTDGRILTRRYAADDQRMGLDDLLRSLSFWPRLAFVDFSPEAGTLGALLAPHFLERISPAELPGFLGADETLQRQARMLADDGATLWAAACALAPAPVDEAQAFALRRQLRLAVAPWFLRTLRRDAPGPAGRLRWPPPLRARYLNWLRAAEAQADAGLDPASHLGQALAFWEEVYDRELKERTKGEEGVLWKDTLAHQHLRMERALLGLWSQEGAPAAIRELYSLHGGPLRQTIEDHLEHLAPLDWGDEGLIHLPWRWEARIGAEPRMLLNMRLGGGMPPVSLHRPGRLWLGLALCLGLELGALVGALVRQPTGPPLLEHVPSKPADAREAVQKLAWGDWRVTVMAGTETATLDVSPAARVAVRWVEETRTSACQPGETGTNQGTVFVRICPGTFLMGSEKGDRDEAPVHEVTLSEYWIGQTEVTEGQYGKTAGSKLPVTEVSWFDARDFCEERGWRLPTEAEWEYAARAGTTTAWSSGDDDTELGEFAWYRENAARPQSVGSKRPNPWGLYDMHGNVWEWVADWYEPYKPGPQPDTEGLPAGNYRVLRGGAVGNTPWVLRSAGRGKTLPMDRNGIIGFRCARGPRRQP